MKQSKLLDSERKGFPTNSQWADIYCLSSLPCSVHLLERLSSFILPENLVVSGMRKYPARLCQVSPASCVQALSPSLEIRKTCCVRPWHSHINALSSRLLSTLPSAVAAFPSPAHQSGNAEFWHWPPAYPGLLQNPISKSGFHICLHRVLWGCWTQSGRGVCSHKPGIQCCQWAVFHKNNDLFICPIHKKCLTKISYSSLCQFSLSLLFLLSEAASFEWGIINEDHLPLIE